MNCEALERDACPCVLADIGHCRCCSLLNGKQFCECDYPGVCIYEKHRWEEKKSLTNCDQIVAVFPLESATGIVIQWAECSSANLGDMLTIRQNSQCTAQGVVMQLHPDQNLVYLLITNKWIGFQETRQITVKRELNVFGADASHLANVTGKSVAILADSAMQPLLNVLVNSLQSQGAKVYLSALDAKLPNSEVDLFVFISRNMQAVSRALKHLPLSWKGNSAFWLVS